METQYTRCNEAPTNFSNSAELCKIFAEMFTSAPGSTIPGSACAKPWMDRGGGGTTGSPGLSQALGVGICT